ncbi:hypothetical protein AZO1586R_1541 [Bathymodiolus azoricus thioautotrophic gill symbiont]|uniref:Uncharacterized protein n=1 Tax=Bathymodiolus azoricus thioautotrophic gill symbiont TaxID=235205 RepID=A0ACA8ZR06_9GAMM|nr:hypothetical protein AZO1586R_1541 [Bathymodiolus azoricus thioautotrophic gill symbiont]CAC9550189.1 hypothetical protein [uncultured Gammaproteobacteria bacterium]
MIHPKMLFMTKIYYPNPKIEPPNPKNTNQNPKKLPHSSLASIKIQTIPPI